MPQKSIAYAVARVHVLERDALGTGHMERLLSSASYGEALRALQEMGWASAEVSDDEQVVAQHVEKACALLREVSPDPAVTDCFLYRYDIQNFKILLKARCLGLAPGLLSACGTVPADKLAHAVSERAYGELPPQLAEAGEALEKRLATGDDPLSIDLILDQTLYRWIFESLGKAMDAKTARLYFTGRVDMLCGIMLLRVRALGRDAAFFRRMLIPGGTVAQEAWLVAFDHPERLPSLLARYGREVELACQRALQSPEALPGLERAMDDALLALFSPLRYAPLSIEPVIGYLLAREREAAAVRLILSAKANGFPAEAVHERLRALYG